MEELTIRLFTADRFSLCLSCFHNGKLEKRDLESSSYQSGKRQPQVPTAESTAPHTVQYLRETWPLGSISPAREQPST